MCCDELIVEKNLIVINAHTLAHIANRSDCAQNLQHACFSFNISFSTASQSQYAAYV